MIYKAVLFDLDGTLLDSIEDMGDSLNRVLVQSGFPTHDRDAYCRFVGDGATNLINRALPEGKRTDMVIRSCLEAFLEDYDKNWNVKTRLYDGIPELLDTLTSRGLKISVLSNKPHRYTLKCMDGFLSDWDFDVVFGQRDDVPRKPDPAGALEIAEQLDISPSDFLYLGDTETDMKTSIDAGMFPVGVLWGFRSAEKLKESGAKELIKRPLEALDLLG
ncbi:MAG: HAD family hydrolase [Candidatus Scalindua sp.]|jgi:phosphoglycolate phosphatase|nr:HAD family hydrolase [Candidatus Scalindua sp.]MBT5307443.1 HAD family hydrolase [Candidatus Scalindua sp.]MBT6225762.1 HAD family hydrolase [Candidatus Scalindua sp.]MBT6561598.1 HAD family hydrolase [Candidatus Scalindua sp.]MBT7212213.1 HAD family hydrolase [Candidatus Scalindua sp.]